MQDRKLIVDENGKHWMEKLVTTHGGHAYYDRIEADEADIRAAAAAEEADQ